MLKVFRENLKYLSWVLWLVIAVFILFVFVDFGSTVPGSGGAALPSSAAATIGDFEVSWAEFESSYRQAETFYQQTYGEQFNRDVARQMGLPIQVLDDLVNEKILLDEAKRMGLRVTDKEVQDHILGLQAFQDSSGNFVGEDRYSQVLSANGYTPDGFENNIRAQLATDKLRGVIQHNLFVSEDEVAQAYREQVERAEIRFVELPTFTFEDQISITDEDLTAFFESRSDDFRFAQRRVADYLLIDPNDLRASLEIDEAELRDFYDRNSSDFEQEEQVHARHILLRIDKEENEQAVESRLQEIRSRIEAGESFETLAKENSDDPGSKDGGGDLGFFGRGQMIREFEEAAFSAQPGDLVGPIKTSFGYHLIQVVELRAAGLRPFEQASDGIRSRLERERSESMAETRASELADRIRREEATSPEALQALAVEGSDVRLETTPAFTREDTVPGIGRATPFTVAVFNLVSDGSTDPIRTPRGWAVAVLREIQEPRIPSLEEVRDSVEDAYREERQMELAEARLSVAREEMVAGKTLDDIAEELELKVQESGEIQSASAIGSLGVDLDLSRRVFAMETGDIGGPLVHGNSVLLFEVTDRKHFDPAEFEQQREQTRNGVRARRVTEMLGTLISSRREELGVEYDTQLLENFGLLNDQQTTG